MDMHKLLKLVSGPVLLFWGAAASFSIWASEATSADLSVATSDYYRGGVCYNFNLQHPEELHNEISIRVRDYFEEANTIVVAAQQATIVQLRFDWALETRDWCGVAIGYMKEAVWDDEAINRCLCFHEYMRAY
ncbi:hypothetical protein [Pseudovibrio sp. JE062]|uniref:hypothetical protein n=1 Tax=Pseudovibrio sp. JE062 TaxID=439495 RepID=UPI000186C27E|nr:hypothetical protein [Pseudovibrio sp. JE062]EEA96630.1 hypothetical protein PJE062_1468 [Pseudovibrio sp. JE062]